MGWTKGENEFEVYGSNKPQKVLPKAGSIVYYRGIRCKVLSVDDSKWGTYINFKRLEDEEEFEHSYSYAAERFPLTREEAVEHFTYLCKGTEEMALSWYEEAIEKVGLSLREARRIVSLEGCKTLAEKIF